MASGCPGPCHPNEASRTGPELVEKFKQQLRLPIRFAVIRQARGQAGKSVHRSGSGPVGCVVELGAGTPLGLPLRAEVKWAQGPVVVAAGPRKKFSQDH